VTTRAPAPAGKRGDLLVHQAEPLNAEPPPAVLAQSDLTAVDAFYVRSHGAIPGAQRGGWRVRVDGLVERELAFSPEELRRRFDEREVLATLECAGNRRADLLAVRDIPGEVPWGPGAAGTAVWRGAPLADVLAAAGVHKHASEIAFEGADVSPEASPPQRFGGSIPLRKALAPEVLLAWEMNGEPLPSIHGGPVRVIVPGYTGARSVKWLQRITASREPSENYFMARAYRLLPADTDPLAAPPGSGIALGPVAVNTAILLPGEGAVVAAGPLEVSGYALSGDDRRIVRVDVSADDGRHWQQAELLDDLGPWAWRRWRTSVALAAGPARLVARAWDSAACTQPEDPAHVWNPTGYANNAWARVALTVLPPA
jgi:sulfite oxidase